MEKIILVKSSSSNKPYTVVVSSKETGLSVSCDCPAGKRGKYCKHKAAIILADDKILYDEDQRDSFNVVKKWLSQSAYLSLTQELQLYEKELEVVKKNVSRQKEKIARLMREGLK